MSKEKTCADADPEDLNPFSFREFLRCKNQNLDHQDLDHHDQNLDHQNLDHQNNRDQDHVVQSAAEEEEDEEGGKTSIAEAVSSFRRIHQVQQDNVSLRKLIKELQRTSNANELRVQQLSEELVRRQSQDQKENQDLESLVQSVEQNLHLMTKRALKAEGSVSNLKVALQQLQVENDRLKAAQSEIVMTMRHNAQVASEYLNKMANHAHSSISQLLGEAETLRLVAQLLKSIDRISTLDPEPPTSSRPAPDNVDPATGCSPGLESCSRTQGLVEPGSNHQSSD